MLITSGDCTTVQPTVHKALEKAVHETEMETYVERNGKHFNEKLADHAVSQFQNMNGTSHHLTRERLREHLRLMGMAEPTHFEDFYYLANMLYSDFFPECIRSEADVVRGAARYVHGDPDGYEGALFHRYCSDLHAKNEKIEWKDFE
jgi:hypothetical protein